jgi:uncharacterized protein
MTNRTTIQRHPERAIPDEAGAVLAQGLVAHVGFCQDGQPFVIALSYHYDAARPDLIYLHGATESRAMLHIAAGNPLCISVTLLDGLVYSRAADGHSINYRSVVCFGHGVSIMPDAEKEAFFAAMTGRYFPQRQLGRDYALPSTAKLHDTLVVAVQIEEMSAKARQGGPTSPNDSDPDAPGSSGVVNFDHP